MLNRSAGLRFPIAFRRGRIAQVGVGDEPTVDDIDAAASSRADHVLTVEKGERPMLYEFGAGLSRYLGDGLPGADAFLEMDIREALRRWCPSVTAGSVAKLVDSQAGLVVAAAVVRHNDSTNESVVRNAVRTG